MCFLYSTLLFKSIHILLFYFKFIYLQFTYNLFNFIFFSLKLIILIL